MGRKNRQQQTEVTEPVDDGMVSITFKSECNFLSKPRSAGDVLGVTIHQAKNLKLNDLIED